MELLQVETPIVIPQYADFSLALPQILVGGAPPNLTNYTWMSQVRLVRNDQSASPLASFTVTVTDAVNAFVSIGLSKANVASMFATAIAAKGAPINFNTQLVCYWDLLGTAPSSGPTTRFFIGPALLSFSVSH